MSCEMKIDVPPTEIEIAEAIHAVAYGHHPTGSTTITIRRMAFQLDRMKEGLRVIARHSVCCDARHAADRILAGGPAELGEDEEVTDGQT